MRAGLTALLPLASWLLLAGCASSLTNDEARVHVVQPGETLYGIAWRYRLDHQQLARWNSLDDPNFIRVGQRIRLAPAGATAPARGASNAGTARSGSSSGSSSRTPASAPARTTPPPAPVLPAPAWQWPTQGPVVTTFGSKAGIATGISINGRAGQAIQAAASGRVVYAGSGLMGYGQLVIIQHNETYLTAYGHNRRLLVDQGQSVVRGQQIAEMGLGPAREPRLHFEIRRNGTPVDPLQYLSASR
jgi:lipoprotein NlpD